MTFVTPRSSMRLCDLRDHVRRAVDGVDAAARESFEEVEGDGAGAAAGVEDGLVAAEAEVVDDGLRPAAHGRADALVDFGVPVGVLRFGAHGTRSDESQMDADEEDA